ncbi:MAG: hypothetical protein AAFQ64_21460 [Pseudomonadota bacterium]
MRIGTCLIASVFACSGAYSQSLSVEELQAQIDARVEALNPYQELLADPDPDRSMAAMDIMITSGDPILVDMAIEFGLLSSNPDVREMALNGFLATGPTLTIAFDGSVTDDSAFRRVLLGSWQGAEGENSVVYATWKIGPFNEALSCYEFDGYSGQCYMRISPGGVSLSGSNLSGQLSNDGSGQLNGTVSINAVPEPIPTTINLLQ